MGAPNGGLVFVGPPPDWRQAWVILRTGRVGNVQRVSEGLGTMEWLPDSELQPVDLQEHVADRGDRQVYAFSFFVELVSSTGKRVFQIADSFQYEWYFREEWDEAPVWKKRAPLGTAYKFVFRPLERGGLPSKTFTVPRR